MSSINLVSTSFEWRAKTMPLKKQINAQWILRIFILAFSPLNCMTSFVLIIKLNCCRYPRQLKWPFAFALAATRYRSFFNFRKVKRGRPVHRFPFGWASCKWHKRINTIKIYLDAAAIWRNQTLTNWIVLTVNLNKDEWQRSSLALSATFRKLLYPRMVFRTHLHLHLHLHLKIPICHYIVIIQTLKY